MVVFEIVLVAVCLVSAVIPTLQRSRGIQALRPDRAARHPLEPPPDLPESIRELRGNAAPRSVADRD